MNYKSTLIILFILLNSVVHSLDLSPAPRGFVWKEILNGQSALLVPNGWYFKHESKPDTEAFFVTKENIDIDGKFTTGLTLNVLKRIDKKANIPPSKWVMNQINVMKSTKPVVRSSENTVGPFKTFLIRIISENQGERIIIHYVYAANDATGTVWLYIFESPYSQWEKAWKMGEVMLRNLALESDI